MEIQEISTWESKLGLLSIDLFPKQETTEQQFIMLNGSTGNFCLELNSKNKYSNNDYFNFAWSADVNAFLKKDEDNNYLLYRLNKGVSNPEKYNSDIVDKNLEKFYEYIGKSNFKENSITAFSIRIFRSLRNLLKEEGNGKGSLQAFLYMLAFIAEGKKGFDSTIWGLDKEVSTIIPETIIEKYISEFENGIRIYDLKPNINLVLRHASGQLFQEAHFEALLNQQLELSNLPTSANKNTIPKYSGVHFTPSYIARTVVEESLQYLFENKDNPKIIKIFDPACGSGEFLKEVLRQLKKLNFEGKIQIIGWDSSEIAINMAKFILAFEKRNWTEAQIMIELKLVNNSLSEEWGNDYDLILMNPPFISWELLNEKDREATKDVLASIAEKKPNLASAFYWKSISSLKKNGVLGTVLPSSILNADSYSKLRDASKEIITHKLIAKLGNYVFANAMTDVCIYIGKNEKTTFNQTTLIWTYNIADAVPTALRSLRKIKNSKAVVLNEKNYSIYTQDNFPKLKLDWQPISYKSIQLIEQILKNNSLKEVKDVFDVKQGARIGSPLFLINKKIYSQLKKKETEYFRPAITNESIKKGELSIDKYLFYPNSIDLQLIDNEDKLQQIVPTYYELVLKNNKSSLSTRARKSEKNWWKLSEHRAWQVGKESKLVSTEFGKSGSFAYDKTGEFVVERGLAWLPKSEKYRDSEDINYFYLAIFCSPFFDELLGIYSKQIAGGGWYYLSKQFMDKIPIPAPEIEQLNSIENQTLINFGKEISFGDFSEEKMKELDNLVRKTYQI